MSNRKSRAAGAAHKSQPKGAGFCAYIGPTILGVIQNGTILRGSKAEAVTAVQTAVEKYPLIQTMIVPGECLGTARIQIKTPGNLLYNNYRRLAGMK